MKKSGGISRRDFLKGTAAAGAGSLIWPIFQQAMVSAAAEKWPSKPIRMVIQYSVGGGTDIFNRGFMQAMEGPLKGTVEVSNMPGAVGAIATDFVLGKPADGYSFLGSSNYNKFLRPMGYHKGVPYKDWQFWSVSGAYMGWGVKPDSPFKNIGDVVEAAKKKPVTMSHSGVGGIWHEADGLLGKAAGVKFNYIPYTGGAPAVLAALQGEVDVASCGVHEQIEFLRSGKLRNLAIFETKPLTIEGMTLEPVTKFVPEAARFAPFGGDVTFGVRRDTPVEILKIINEAYFKAFEDPRLGQVLEKSIGYKSIRKPAENDRMSGYRECMVANVFYELEISKIDPKDLGLPKSEDFDKWWPPKDYKQVLF